MRDGIIIIILVVLYKYIFTGYSFTRVIDDEETTWHGYVRKKHS